jgi:tetratricopeptide (TPR) repeat protein
MSKILLCCIFKDDSEIDQVSRMLESFMPNVDGLCVALTGPSGKFHDLIKLIKKYDGKYTCTSPMSHPNIYHKRDDGSYIFANFSEARNVCWQLADTLTGYDFYSWSDKDDILVGGENLHKIADRALTANIDAVFFTYWYSVRVKKDGTFNDKDVQIDQMRERLLRPGKFKWVSRLHEICTVADDTYKPKFSDWPYVKDNKENIVWVHLTDDDQVDKAMQRNIDILNIQIEEEDGKDPRTQFYLAKTYYDLNKPELDDKAIDLLAKYLEKSGWKEERASAWEYLGKIYERKGNQKEAIESYMEATKEWPKRHLNFLNLAKVYFEMGDIDTAEFWCDVALGMQKPEARTTIGNPLEIMYKAASIKYNIALSRMKIDDAIMWRKKVNEMGGFEDDGMIKTLEEAKYDNQIAQAIFNFAKYLRDKGNKSNVAKLMEIIPDSFKEEPFVSAIANTIAEPKIWGDKTIVYYASWGTKHFEAWSPESVKKGIGGSETAVIELSKEWVKLGYDVTVFADCGEAKDYDGVHYKPYWQINWRDKFNILILWRSPHLLDIEIDTKKLYMDLHDIASQMDWTDKRMERIDKVFFKSKWHRGHIPKLSDSKAVIISNGIYE